jgi:dolichol-phosphate mannosyltransferase
VRTDEKTWSAKKTWLLIGVVMGLGMNSKLTCCLIGLGLGLFLLLTPRLRWQLRTPWPYVAALITFAMMTPVFLWNSQHDWASFNYQFMSRHQEAHHLDFTRWLQFWSYQWIFMSPVVYLLMLTAFIYALTKLKDDRWRFVFALPAPALALFYYQPLMSAYKPHWSGPAYMILLFGACKIFLDGIPGILKAKNKILAGVALVFFIPFQLLYIPLLTPIIPQIFAAASPGQKWNPTWDFTNEFYGWLELGDHVKKIQEDLALKNGKKPLLGAQRYELIAQFTWATKDTVWQLGRDRDNYLYEQTDEDRAKLIGQDFLIVNNDKYEQDPLEIARFDSCEKQQWPFYRKSLSGDEILSRVFNIYYCRNYQGLR